MSRVFLLGLVILGLSCSLGCTMCAHPYDYCGPTFDAARDECGDGGACGMGDCNACDPMARAGSILSPSLGTVAVDASPRSATPTPARPATGSRGVTVEQGQVIDSVPEEPIPTPIRTTQSPWRNDRPRR